MADKIAGIIYALLFVMPLIFSALCLFKVVLVDWPKKKNISLVAKLSILLPSISIVSFLIYFIVVKFVFTSVKMSNFYNTLGIVLFFTYFGLFVGVSYGLGSLGHSGMSPGIVVQELFKILKKRTGRLE